MPKDSDTNFTPANDSPESPDSADYLRSIALTVEEDEPGHFTWVLLESQGDAVVFDVELACGEQAFPSYRQALEAGFDALTDMCDDKNAGPRASAQEDDSDQVGTDAYGGNP